MINTRAADDSVSNRAKRVPRVQQLHFVLSRRSSRRRATLLNSFDACDASYAVTCRLPADHKQRLLAWKLLCDVFASSCTNFARAGTCTSRSTICRAKKIRPCATSLFRFAAVHAQQRLKLRRALSAPLLAHVRVSSAVLLVTKTTHTRVRMWRQTAEVDLLVEPSARNVLSFLHRIKD